jgi:hypothetical protein
MIIAFGIFEPEDDIFTYAGGAAGKLDPSSFTL